MPFNTEFICFVTIIGFDIFTKVGLSGQIVFRTRLGPEEAGCEGFYCICTDPWLSVLPLTARSVKSVTWSYIYRLLCHA